MRTTKEALTGEKLADPVSTFGFQRLLFTADRKDGNAFDLAVNVLNTFSQAGDRHAEASGAKEKLATAILEHYPKFLLETLPTEADGFYELRGDILEIDARFADYVARHFGTHGKEIAETIRKDEDTIKVASDSIPVREWSRKWREFSQTDSGKEISEKEKHHAQTIVDTYRQNIGEVDIESDPAQFLAWIKGSPLVSWKELQEDLLPLFEEQVRFTGPLDGLQIDLFFMWLGKENRFAKLTSLRNLQFASVLWLHIVRPGIEREGRALIRVSSPISLAMSKRSVALNVDQDFVAVEVEGGFQLSLDGAGAPPGSLAQFLSDEVFHTYLVTQMLFFQNGMPENGAFSLESGYGTILDAKGFDQHERIKRVGGKTITVREHFNKNIETAKKHIENLGKIYVLRVGDFSTTAKKMPLVYDITNGKQKERSLRHHPLVVEHFRSKIGAPESAKKERNFVQVPRALIEQTNSSAVRYGYAYVQAVRDGSYHSVKSKEPITIKLRAAAELVGKDNKSKRSEKAFYKDIAERYAEAAEVGDLGRVEMDMTSEKLILRPEAHIIEPYIQKIPKPRNRKK